MRKALLAAALLLAAAPVAPERASGAAPRHAPPTRPPGAADAVPVQNDPETLRQTRELIALARPGDADAQFLLATLHIRGLNDIVREDRGLAYHWANEAAKRGHAGGQILLARFILMDGADDPAAARLLRSAAAKGNPEAMTVLARLHREGRGVARDDAEAFRLMQTAARQGYLGGTFGVGVYLVRGIGVAPNPELGDRLIRDAAARGWAPAQRYLDRQREERLASPPPTSAAPPQYAPQPRPAPPQNAPPPEPPVVPTPGTTGASSACGRFPGLCD